jgi:hypothetical protein
MGELDVEAVRRAAVQGGLHEIYFNQTSRVVSFAPNPDDPRALTRINIYYSTGTVGMCLEHPQQGKTQLFRRDVSMPLLRELMQDPRLHTGTGYHRRNVRQRLDPCVVCLDKQPYVTLACGHTLLCGGCADQLPRVNGRVRCPVCRTDSDVSLDPNDPKDEELEALVQIDRLQAAACEIAEQMQAVAAVVSACQARREEEARRHEEARRQEQLQREEAERQRRAAEAAARNEQLQREEAERQRRSAEAAAEAAMTARFKRAQEIVRKQELRGTRCTYSIPKKWHTHIDENFDKDTLSVALGESCIVMLHEGAGWSSVGALPKLLQNTLRGRQRSLPDPTYVSIGSSTEYYIRFADGLSEWVGPDSLTNELKSTSRSVRSMAFGEEYDTWFVVYHDGSWTGNGDLPYGLSQILRKDGRANLAHVSLGPKGEYYISKQNGRAWWGGMSESNIDLIRRFKDRVTFMDFGGDDNLFVRYE